jgi:nitronate monooxygenase
VVSGACARNADKSVTYTPFCVFLSFGDPSPFAAEIANSGAVLICQVQFLSQIDVALKAGAAAIVAQGSEAGGHGASRSTFPFVPEAADYLKRHSPETLLFAAGGIADSRGLAAALMLGADGVVVGSRFWASAEALTSKVHTEKAVGVTGDSTIRTKVLDALRGTPWPKEYSFRFLKNKLTDEWANREAEAFAAFGTLSEQYAEARARHDLQTEAVVCGEVVGLLKDRPTAESIVSSMVADAERLLRRGSPFAMILVALGMAVIVSCFAEVASQFSEPGGAYLYVRTAFGRFAGMQISWFDLLNMIATIAALSNLFVDYLATFSLLLNPLGTVRW